MNGRKGRWIQTVSGIAYWPADPSPEDVRLHDIAHSLSRQCRYTGHVPVEHYSVAEHSVYVSQCVPAELAIYGLLHDAEEAYLGDVSRPVKDIFREHGITLLDDLAALNTRAIAQHLGLDAELFHHPLVKRADDAVLLAEKEQLRPNPPMPWNYAEGVTPAPIHCQGYSPTVAKMLFLRRFAELTFKRDTAACF